MSGSGELMNCYLVMYLSRSLEEDYFSGHVAAALENAFPKQIFIGDDSWLVVTDCSAKDIVAKLKVRAHPKDGFFVLRSGTESAWLNIDDNQEDWLRENL